MGWWGAAAVWLARMLRDRMPTGMGDARVSGAFWGSVMRVQLAGSCGTFRVQEKAGYLCSNGALLCILLKILHIIVNTDGTR
jgi:hypothetical protein